MTGTIYLESQEISIDETAGTVQVAILRSGDTSGAVQVDYEVTADNATPGQDYVPASGTITIPAGATRVVVPVQILDDNAFELTETFVLSILKVDSGTLFAPRTVRVDIQDNENPVVDPPQPPLVSDFDVSREAKISGLDQPIAFEWSPTDSSLIYVAEKAGKIKLFDTDTNAIQSVFDITTDVNSAGDRGLLDIALHPDFAANPYIYAFYVVDPSDTNGNTGFTGRDGEGNRYAQVVRWQVDATGNIMAASKTIILGGAGTSLTSISGAGAVDSTVNFSQRASDLNADGSYRQDYLKVDSLSHAGGSLEFGPDGALYVSVGDGVSYNATDVRAASVQSIDALAGKILRIDPMTGEGFADNPFVTSGVDLDSNRAKVYQLGLRNPFAISFDSAGKLIISETGWNTYEEINSAGAGANFGWPYYEGGDGNQILKTNGYRDTPEAAAFYDKVANGTVVITAAYRAFAHADGDPGFQVQAIVGADDVVSSNVYPASLSNDYFFTDIAEGEIFSVDAENRNEVKFLYKQFGFAPAHFKQGPDGYMYYADLAEGRIGRFLITEKTPPPPPPTPSGANLIIDGDFETTRMTAQTPWQSFANGQLQGWRNTDASGLELIRSGTTQKLDLDVVGAADNIYQDVTTVAGHSYTLKFSALASQAGSSDFDVLWNGTVIATVSPTAANQTYTYSVTGTGGSDRLAFRELAAQNNYNGAYLDDVSLIDNASSTASATTTTTPESHTIA